MNISNPFSSIRFADLMANPHIQALIDAITEWLPDSEWNIVDVNGKLQPFPVFQKITLQTGSTDEPLPPSVMENLQSNPKHYRNSKLGSITNENGTVQGFARLWFQGAFIGAVRISRIPAQNQFMLQKALRIIEGYFSLLSEVLEDHDELELVNNLWSETVSVIKTEDLLEQLISEFCRTLKVEYGIIFLVDEDGDFHPSEIKGFPEELIKIRNVNVSKFDYLHCIPRDNFSLYCMNQDDPLRLWLLQQLVNVGWEQSQSYAELSAIPFFRGTNLIGLFITIIPDEWRITQNRQKLIQLLSSGGAAALDNALTLDSMNQRRKALSTIHVVHRLISTNIPYKDLLPRIGQLTRNLLKVKKCSIMMYDRQRKTLNPSVCLDLDGGEVGQETLKIGEGLPGWVAEQFTPKLYYPREDEAAWDSIGEVYPEDAYLSVPLFDNDIEGVITVSGKEGFFKPTDREILMTFSEQVVLAIKNVRMNEGHRAMTLSVMQTIANLIETQDPQKSGITAETCNWAKKIAVRLNKSDTEIQDINYAALLHDTGMLRTLYTDLPEDEQRIRGPELSLHVVESLGLPDTVGENVYHVNEAWNGEGYPKGLKGSQIPIGSRIIAVAKMFVAVKHRYLKRGESETAANDRACKLVERMSKRAFDPDVIQALKDAIVETIP